VNLRGARFLRTSSVANDIAARRRRPQRAFRVSRRPAHLLDGGIRGGFDASNVVHLPTCLACKWPMRLITVVGAKESGR
jgi:hypothetical protein